MQRVPTTEVRVMEVSSEWAIYRLELLQPSLKSVASGLVSVVFALITEKFAYQERLQVDELPLVVPDPQESCPLLRIWIRLLQRIKKGVELLEAENFLNVVDRPFPIGTDFIDVTG